MNTVSITTGNEKNAKPVTKTQPSPKVAFSREQVTNRVRKTPTTGPEAVKLLAMFANSVKLEGGPLLEHPISKNGKTTVRVLLRQFKTIYENPGLHSMGSVAKSLQISSGVQNPILKACWEYCNGFQGCKMVTGGGLRGKTGIAGLIKAADTVEVADFDINDL